MYFQIHVEECCQLKNKEHLYEAVMILRLLKEAMNETEVWKKLNELEDHLENRMNSEDWMFFHEKVIQDLFTFSFDCYFINPSIIISQVCENVLVKNVFDFYYFRSFHLFFKYLMGRNNLLSI